MRQHLLFVAKRLVILTMHSTVSPLRKIGVVTATMRYSCKRDDSSSSILSNRKWCQEHVQGNNGRDAGIPSTPPRARAKGEIGTPRNPNQPA